MKKPDILAEQILHEKFPTEFPGYKMESVNNFLDKVYIEMKAYEEEVIILNGILEENKIRIAELESKNNHYQSRSAEAEKQLMEFKKKQLSNSDFVKQTKGIDVIQKSLKEIKQTLEKLENK
ncbi:DivIVA domain-containing protein [Mesoplasma melaleucae]|uniref:DivIVA domain-containing protein n=1 Tax=Mesoplasma melaleucae TaxID=81459 RepID=A0A2K8NVM6_9MOLU|nr:DivIVA domain-containing protein [Mesoplasma melaleucae]ATZ17890.1 hypothetical protein EMELA_v1c03190 [Mesoplasma melaleucae]